MGLITGLLAPHEVDEIIRKHLEEKYPGKEIFVMPELEHIERWFGTYDTKFDGYSFSVTENENV